jgi:hypothetical protein
MILAIFLFFNMSIPSLPSYFFPDKAQKTIEQREKFLTVLQDNHELVDKLLTSVNFWSTHHPCDECGEDCDECYSGDTEF